ncbi:MAG: flippase, partial [Ignavibacteriales bacterium]|nr:flippase [Ignavibacteriales bacterium]
MNYLKTIYKNILSLSVAELFSRIINLFTTAYLARVILPEGFGIINFATAFVSYFVLFVDFGLDSIGTRDIARNKKEVGIYAGTFLIFRLSIALGISIVYFIIVHSLNLSLLEKNILYLTGLNLFLTAIMLQWIFRAYEQMKYISIGQIIGSIINLIGVVLIVEGIKDLEQVIIIGLVATLINNIFIIFIYKIKIGKVHFNIKLSLLKNLIKDAYPIGISLIMIAIYYNLDHIMLGFMVGNKAVGFYSAAYKILMYGIVPAAIIINSFFPKLSQYVGQKDELKLLMSKLSLLMFIVGTTISLFCFLFAKEIILLFYGDKYFSSIILLQILMVNVFIIYVNMTYGNPLNAWNKQKEYLKIIVLGALTNIALNFILIPKYYAFGAAIATLSSEIVVLVGIIYVHYKFLKKIHFVIISKLIPIVCFVSLCKLGIGHFLNNSFLVFLITFSLFILLINIFKLFRIKEYFGDQ